MTKKFKSDKLIRTNQCLRGFTAELKSVGGGVYLKFGFNKVDLKNLLLVGEDSFDLGERTGERFRFGVRGFI